MDGTCSGSKARAREKAAKMANPAAIKTKAVFVGFMASPPALMLLDPDRQDSCQGILFKRAWHWDKYGTESACQTGYSYIAL
jgi:hypothetical protein